MSTAKQRAKEILLQVAADYEANPRLWIRGSGWYREGGLVRRCLLGQVAHVCREEPTALLCEALREALPKRYQDYGAASITRWNDSPDRTVEQVITLCRKAASEASCLA